MVILKAQVSDVGVDGNPPGGRVKLPNDLRQSPIHQRVTVNAYSKRRHLGFVDNQIKQNGIVQLRRQLFCLTLSRQSTIYKNLRTRSF